MNLGEFRKRTKDLDDQVVITVAEVDEVASINITAVDVVDDAKVVNPKADGQEAVEIGSGSQKAVVLRY